MYRRENRASGGKSVVLLAKERRGVMAATPANANTGTANTNNANANMPANMNMGNKNMGNMNMSNMNMGKPNKKANANKTP